MPVINYPSSSPYFLTQQTNLYINHFVFRPVPPDPAGTDLIITLQQQYQYRPDKLSHDLYNDNGTHWWIFCVRNPFLRPDPIWSFIVGTTIFVPTLKYLTRILGS